MNKNQLAIFALLAMLLSLLTVVHGNYDFCTEGLTKIEKFFLAQELVCTGEFADIKFVWNLSFWSFSNLNLDANFNQFCCSFRYHKWNKSPAIQDTKISFSAIVKSTESMLRNKEVRASNQLK